MTPGYKYLFGPVLSRRLGMSLGVDLIPHKICTLNCVYCECGGTTTLTHERREYVPYEAVCGELEHFFNLHPDPETITFSGAGEPTLHSRIGEVISFIKQLKPAIPLAVLTNGTLFSDPLVRKELMMADLVLPSLDAAREDDFRKINRPRKDLDLGSYIQGLIDFRAAFNGEMWLEVLILPGYNDDESNIHALKEEILRINPHRVQLNTLDRPGSVEGLESVAWKKLEGIAAGWGLDNVEVIAPPQVKHAQGSYRSDVEQTQTETQTETLTVTLDRRPCTLEDLEEILGLQKTEILKQLDPLLKSGRIETRRQERGLFYQGVKPG